MDLQQFIAVAYDLANNHMEEVAPLGGPGSTVQSDVEQLIKKATANHGESIAGYECPNVLELMVARCSRHVCRSVQEKTLAKHTDQLEHQESRLACEWQAAGYSMIDNIAGCTPIISNLLL